MPFAESHDIGGYQQHMHSGEEFGGGFGGGGGGGGGGHGHSEGYGHGHGGYGGNSPHTPVDVRIFLY